MSCVKDNSELQPGEFTCQESKAGASMEHEEVNRSIACQHLVQSIHYYISVNFLECLTPVSQPT
jgi:hypothetical protein